MSPSHSTAPARSSTAPSHRRLLPTSRVDDAELERLSAGRDRVVDLVRISSLVLVVIGHSVMLTVGTGDGGIVLGNILGEVPALQPLTWIFQILPLFFFAGAAAATYGWRPGNAPGHWLLARVQRLLRPVGWYLAAAITVLALARGIGAVALADVVAGLSVQLLWFLGAYILVLSLVPLLQRITTRGGVALTLGACVGVTALIDAIRLTVGPGALGYLNVLGVWLIPAVLGVAYAKRLLSPVVAAVVAAAAFIADVALVGFGPYEMSLVTVPGQQLSNITPPTLLLAGHALTLCAAVIACRGLLARVAARPRIWRWVVCGNRGAMTLYLWHLPVLGCVVGAGIALGYPRQVGTSLLPVTVCAQTALLMALMVPVTLLLSALENHRLRWWDDAVARSAAPARDGVVLVALLTVAITILLLARDGLAVGAGWLVLGFGAAALARMVADLQISTSRRSTTLNWSRRGR